MSIPLLPLSRLNTGLTESNSFSDNQEGQVSQKIQMYLTLQHQRLCCENQSLKTVSYDKRKSYFNPSETRKRIMTYTDKKINFLKQKEISEHDLSNYAKEEHEKHMLHKEEAHKKSMLHKEDAHQKAMQQQEELHQIEVECNKQHLENMK
ncbi:unnamed protein product [Pieris macdunnoughi]|uniref:Uncharacterized protein n=1 Tax=Pieris macdunnoughi TaxID=345717 RepID=A0A821UL03_9NEOP|nr:unnamed protein product [Pieris macdunnoughi]